MSADQITITGNIGQDPELRYTPNGKAVVSFSVGNTPRNLNRTTQEWEDQTTTWLRVEAWEGLAENVGKSLTKGKRVVVVGSLISEEYTDRQGEKRTAMKIRAEDIAVSLRNATVSGIERATRSENAGGGARPAQNNRPSNNDETPF